MKARTKGTNKVKSFYRAMENDQKLRQPTELVNIFVNHTSDNKLAVKLPKELHQQENQPADHRVHKRLGWFFPKMRYTNDI